MKSRIYGFLRTVFKLPRPNEIWGDQAENKWNLVAVVSYLKFTTGHTSSWIGHIFGLIQTILLLGIVTKRTSLLILAPVVLAGAIGMAIAGHILIALGLMRKENDFAAAQSTPTVKILENTEKILEKLGGNDIISKNGASSNLQHSPNRTGTGTETERHES